MTEQDQGRMARGILATLAGAIAWGFSGTCIQYLFASIEIDALLLTAFSRNYLGVHTPQDVLVGLLLSGLALLLVSRIFADTLARWRETGKPIPLLYGHSTEDPEYNIGKVVEAYEDERGLFVRCEFDADNPKAQYVRKLVQQGRLYQFSFAYQVLDAGTVELESGIEAYELRKLDLFEVSLVQIPANQHAEVTEVKSDPKCIGEVYVDIVPRVKAGRRNSKADEDELRRVLDLANTIAATVQSLIGDEQDEPDQPEDKPEEPAGAKGEDSTAKEALEALKDEAIALLTNQ